MSAFDEFYPVALEMLNDDFFGAPAQLTRQPDPQDGVYDFITDRYSDVPTTPTVLPVRSVVTEIDWNEKDGQVVKRSTAVLLVQPKRLDKLTLGSLNLTVERVKSIAPQGQAILYFAEVI